MVLKTLGMGFVLNWPGLVVALAVFALLARRDSVSRAVAYSSFVLLGAAVARFQWVLVVRQDPDTIGWDQFATVLLVIFLTLTVLVSSYRTLRRDKPLFVMFLLTLVLGGLQFGGAPVAILNGYARLYALVCIVIPLTVVVVVYLRNPKRRRS